MNPISDQPRLEAVPPPTDPAVSSPYQPCEHCGAPLDERQRYCVVCGARRRHADDPAARFLAASTRRRRPGGETPGASASTAAERRRRSAPVAVAAAIAAIPLALGVGVVIGRSSAGGDGKLIAALRAEKAPVIQYAGSGAGVVPASGSAAVAGTDTSPPTSTFPLSHGYTVQLGTLPSGATRDAAAKAERAARAKGATGVGVIAPADFRLTPSPPAGAYVVYAGSYSTSAPARLAVSRLKGRFPHAKVVAVKAVAGSSGSGGKVLTQTRYGTAHQVDSYRPTASSLAQGAQVAAKDSHATGQAASGSGLPDVVAVP